MSATYATAADVIAIAPELSGVDATVLDSLVDEAKHHIVASSWGTKMLDGHRLLVAHFATINFFPENAVGAIASRTFDKLSESYAVGAVSDTDLARTKYGERFMRLRKTLVQSKVIRPSTTSGWDRGEQLL